MTNQPGAPHSTRGSLIAAGAAHAVLAKTLYGEPPPGTACTVTDVARGAELMYYGGDLVEIWRPHSIDHS